MKLQRGFTLVEVLVALAVFALAAAALIDSINSGLRAEHNMYQRTLAYWVAQNQFAKMQLNSDWPASGVLNGQSEVMGRHVWHWRVTIKPTTLQQLKRIEIEVRQSPEQTTPDATLVGFLARSGP
ncbi:MAG: type II secretion system protein GspI [Gammaproteobacteria bacterium]|nr:MAG: type II secretion system protein GspI [Gammaproteobacteria bacterium]